jgi:hypothetical protein
VRCATAAAAAEPETERKLRARHVAKGTDDALVRQLERTLHVARAAIGRRRQQQRQTAESDRARDYAQASSRTRSSQKGTSNSSIILPPLITLAMPC